MVAVRHVVQEEKYDDTELGVAGCSTSTSFSGRKLDVMKDYLMVFVRYSKRILG
jgi:hypothetical protein